MFSSAKILIILLVTVQLSSVSCLDEDQKNQAYDVVHKILGIYTDLSSVLSFLPTVGPAFGILGAILGFVSGFIPQAEDPQFKAIMENLDRIQESVNQLSKDIDDLGNKLHYDIRKLNIQSHIVILEKAMEYSKEIASAESSTARDTFRAALKSLCSGEACSLAIENVIAGVVGDSTSEGVVLSLYKLTKGHKSQIEKYSKYLLGVVYRGLVATMTYVSHEYGIDFANKITENLQPKLTDMSNTIKDITDACVRNAKLQMQNDITDLVKSDETDRKSAHNRVANHLRDKYDWLDVLLLTYRKMNGWDNHCYDYRRSVSYIKYFENFNILVFFRNHTNCTLNDNTRHTAHLCLIKDSTPDNAWLTYRNIIRCFDRPGLSYWGAAVIKLKGSNIYYTNINVENCRYQYVGTEFVKYLLPMEGSETWGKIRVNESRSQHVMSFTFITLLILSSITLFEI